MEEIEIKASKIVIKLVDWIKKYPKDKDYSNEEFKELSDEMEIIEKEAIQYATFLKYYNKAVRS